MNIRVQGVSIAFTHSADPESVPGLRQVAFNIEPGEQVAIIGPSGAGKTTLLRLLATALRPDSGELQLLDSQPWLLSGRVLQQLRARIALVQQTPPLPPRQRVVTAVAAGRTGQWSRLKSAINLVYPLDIDGVRTILARLDLADKLFHRCDQLSGGQLQRVAIARALYQQPQILLADEPVSAMDPVLAEHTLALLSRAAEQRGATLVASLHNLTLALRHFPRVIGLRDGRIQFDKPASEISESELEQLYSNEQLFPANVQSGQSPATRVSATPPHC